MALRELQAVDDNALRRVVEGTAAHVGPAFFRALVRNLAAVMGTASAWVTEYLPESRRLRAHAFWLHGDFVDEYEQPVDGSPCEVIITDRKLVHIPERMGELYPDNANIRMLALQSYLGVPLLDTDDSIMGHLAVMDTKPLPMDERRLVLFEVFAARAAAEQRRMRQEIEVRAREEEIRGLFDSAMDAVLMVDEAGVITRANPPAERMFGCEEEDLRGSGFRDFLPEDGLARFDAFVAELTGAGNRHLWIPRSLTVRRADGAVFPAEATLSRFTQRGQAFHTIILRNVNDRLAAERRIARLTAETEFLRGDAGEPAGLGDMIGGSAAMRELFASLRRVAATDATVLVTGETGTGKELIARSLHESGPRREWPLVRVNCAAIPGTLMESELFGHERGAFTGATTRREGRFSLADRGTIFLDEVGELPLELQAKLLRVLQEGEFEPLGGARTRRVDVRVIAATNRDLAAMVAAGTFREDLFYRLNVFPLRVPPLRERGDDVARLAQAFVERFARRMGLAIEPFGAAEIARLQAYPWPGNVRELQNVIERALILATDGRPALEQALPLPAPVAPEVRPALTPPVMTAAELLALERDNLTRALAEAGGKVAGPRGAAARLGLPASTLASRIKALGLARAERTRG